MAAYYYDYKLDGSDNDRIRRFYADIENAYNCEHCPDYRPDHCFCSEGLPCGLQHCHVVVTNENE